MTAMPIPVMAAGVAVQIDGPTSRWAKRAAKVDRLARRPHILTKRVASGEKPERQEDQTDRKTAPDKHRHAVHVGQTHDQSVGPDDQRACGDQRKPVAGIAVSHWGAL